jgi:endonuclease/exonuclease/phosphatase (EEP) superfamily protein YafD
MSAAKRMGADTGPSDRALRVWRLERAVQVAAAVALLVTAVSYLGSRYWLPELLTHFRFQYTCAALVLLLVAAVRRQSVSAFVILLVVTANLIPLLPYLLSGPAPAQASALSLRVMSLNVHFRNSDHDAVRALIQREAPDIVGLSEVNAAWIDALSSLTAEYPYTVLRPEQGAHGLAVYSRVPIRERETSPYIERGTQAAISVHLDLAGAGATLTLAHLMAPTSARKAGLRNLQIRKMAEMVRADHGKEQIFIGDLNITPWSPYYAQLEEGAGLVNAADGRGYLPTWPAGFYVFRIPIDHVLLSGGFAVQQIRTAPSFGSDHLPIIADVSIVEAGQLE